MQFRFLPKAVILVMFLFVGAELANAQLIPNLGTSRSGTSGFQFLKIGVDARSAGMGSSNVADAKDGSSLFWNPALAVQMDKNEVFNGYTRYFADINLNYLSYTQQFNGYAIGGSFTLLDSGEMDETTEFNPFGTGRTFRTVHMAAGLTFSQELTSLFSYGITLKYLDERIEEVSVQTAVIDVGFFYRVGDTGLRFAVGVNNFGFDANPHGETTRLTLNGSKTEDDFERISPPTTFILGTAYDVYSDNGMNAVLTASVTNPSDNAETLNIGGELEYLNRFFLRAGYEFGADEYYLPSLGAGFMFPYAGRALNIDYAFSTRERLGALHRIALKFNF